MRALPSWKHEAAQVVALGLHVRERAADENRPRLPSQYHLPRLRTIRPIGEFGRCFLVRNVPDFCSDQSAPNLSRYSATRRGARAIFMGSDKEQNKGLDDKQIWFDVPEGAARNPGRF